MYNGKKTISPYVTAACVRVLEAQADAHFQRGPGAVAAHVLEDYAVSGRDILFEKQEQKNSAALATNLGPTDKLVRR